MQVQVLLFVTTSTSEERPATRKHEERRGHEALLKNCALQSFVPGMRKLESERRCCPCLEEATGALEGEKSARSPKDLVVRSSSVFRLVSVSFSAIDGRAVSFFSIRGTEFVGVTDVSFSPRNKRDEPRASRVEPRALKTATMGMLLLTFLLSAFLYSGR